MFPIPAFASCKTYRPQFQTALAVPCQVIAPALTPRKADDRIKTDHRDAAKLVRCFRAGELTPIHVPDEAAEAARDLVRCREEVRRARETGPGGGGGPAPGNWSASSGRC